MSNLSGLFSNGTQTGQRLRLLHVVDEKPATTTGDSSVASTWTTRVLNTVKTNEIDNASLNSNQITLPAGKYIIESSAPAWRVNGHKTRWRDITNSLDILIGSVEYIVTSDSATNRSMLSGEFTLSVTTTFELQHNCSVTQGSGFGIAAGFSTPEIYSEVKIWQILDSRTLPYQAELLHVEDQKASGVHAGTFTAGSWVTRVLNTEVTNQIENASLSANQITLPAGRYYMEAQAPARKTDQTMAKFTNITDASDIFSGSSEYLNSGDNTSEHCFVSGEFTLSATKVLELQHRGTITSSTNGLGVAAGVGFTVDHETYAVVKIWKLS